MIEIATWRGKQINEMSREELIEAMNSLANMLELERNEKSVMIDCLDMGRYLKEKHLG